MKIREEDKMDEDSNEDLFDRKELRKKKNKKRNHKSVREKEETAKESFKRMKEELDELRKKESERAKELEELKKKIEEKEKVQQPELIHYALGFDKNAYLNKGFIESAQWVKNDIAKKMIEKMNEEGFKEKFSTFLISKNASVYLGYRACARFNRNEECNLGQWHLTHKPDGLWTQNGLRQRHGQEENPGEYSRVRQQRRNEIRLHVCTLCLEALGSAVGHCILDCPWILEKNWKN